MAARGLSRSRRLADTPGPVSDLAGRRRGHHEPIRLAWMIQDRELTKFIKQDLKPVHEGVVRCDDLFLDGPISRRVAVLDFGEKTGKLGGLLEYVSPVKPGGCGTYVEPESSSLEDRIATPEFRRVSVFATTLLTVRLFEDALGREVRWAFDGKQLLVVPHAGTWRNAVYTRDTHSLKFYSFESRRHAGKTIHTSLSQDIVAHETAHAIVDGIVPYLQDAMTPQASAIPEAIADITAVLVALQTEPLVDCLLEYARAMGRPGEIPPDNAFSWIAEEFGEEDPGTRGPALRSLYNDWTIQKPPPETQSVGRHEPHGLSLILSGALYSLILKFYDRYRSRGAKKDQKEEDVWKWAVMKTAGRCSQLFLRALDYLPPGEMSFADYGRALLASVPGHSREGTTQRQEIREEFIRRGILTGSIEKGGQGSSRALPVDLRNLQSIFESDWEAIQFAETHRDLLGIPSGVRFEVRPREHLERRHEVLFKVYWDHVEKPEAADGDPLLIVMGTTLCIDAATGRVRFVLTTDADAKHRVARRARLNSLVEHLTREQTDYATDTRRLVRLPTLERGSGYLRVEGTSRMLHLAPDQEPQSEAEAATSAKPPPGVDNGAFHRLARSLGGRSAAPSPLIPDSPRL